MNPFRQLSFSRLVPVFLLLLAVTATGCDSGGSNEESDAYLGTWDKEGQDQYMELTEDQMIVYARFTGDCYDTYTFDVVERDGATWQLDDPGENGETIEVTVDGDELTLVEDDGDVVHWTRTDLDPEADLDLC